MPVSLSQDALRQNIRRVAELAAAAGLSPSVALKTPFVRPPVLAALRPALLGPTCVFSTDALALLPPHARAELSFIGLAVPNAYANIVARCGTSLHTSTATITAVQAAAASARLPHGIWLGYRTSEDREGFPTKDLRAAVAWFCEGPRAPLYLAGLLANWGCAIERPPAQHELNQLFDAADQIAEAYAMPQLAVSVGGSVLLPVLSRLRDRQRPIQLRIGEAALIGTVPGASGINLRLQRPFSITAEVVQDGGPVLGSPLRRVLLNVGSLDVEIDDCVINGCGGRLIRSSTEMTVAEIEHAGPEDALGCSVTLALGFKSAVRTLARSIDLRIAGALSALDATGPRWFWSNRFGFGSQERP